MSERMPCMTPDASRKATTDARIHDIMPIDISEQTSKHFVNECQNKCQNTCKDIFSINNILLSTCQHKPRNTCQKKRNRSIMSTLHIYGPILHHRGLDPNQTFRSLILRACDISGPTLDSWTKCHNIFLEKRKASPKDPAGTDFRRWPLEGDPC